MALGIADRVWSIGDLIDAALATQPIDPPTDSAGAAEAVPGNRGRLKIGED